MLLVVADCLVNQRELNDDLCRTDLQAGVGMNWLRTTALSLLVTLSQTASSQVQPSKSVDALIGLYKGCVIAHFQSVPFREKTAADTTKMLVELEDKCLDWTLIWFTPLMRLTVDQLTDADISLFNYWRHEQMKAAHTELVTLYKLPQ